MNRIQTQLPFLKILSLSIGFSIVLLGVRFLKTGTTFYFFLLWNLFLAAIPYGISILLSLKNNSKYPVLFWAGFLIWLAFLPNAPYLITDIKHIKISTLSAVWLDVLLILSFALNGLMMGFASVQMMQSLAQNWYSKLLTTYTTYAILLSCGFGIYMGRVLRWNSWDIITNPIGILTDIGKRILYPIHYIDTWAFTLSFGIFLIIIYKLVQYKTQYADYQKQYYS